MLYNCSELLLFWAKFTRWWEEKFSETIVLSVNAILFGWHQNASNKRVLNYILIITKYYIFTTSVCNNKLSFNSFLLCFNSKLDVLHTIAIKNKSLNKFETTSAPLDTNQNGIILLSKELLRGFEVLHIFIHGHQICL